MADNEFVVKDSGARQEFETGAKRDTQDDKPRPSLVSPFAIERIAWVYTRGAKKYGDHNWQKGMPYSRYLDSAERHLLAFKKGETDEDHLAQACWNLMSILHHQEAGPEGLDDLIKYVNDDGDEKWAKIGDALDEALTQAKWMQSFIQCPRHPECSMPENHLGICLKPADGPGRYHALNVDAHTDIEIDTRWASSHKSGNGHSFVIYIPQPQEG